MWNTLRNCLEIHIPGAAPGMFELICEEISLQEFPDEFQGEFQFDSLREIVAKKF